MSVTTSTTTLVTVLQAAGRAGIATCLWGDPGTGKSSLVAAVAAAEGVPCETVIGSLREPSDFAGLPVVSETGVRMEPPAWAKRLSEAGAGVAFLDELSTAAPAVQAAMLGVVLDRQVGDLTLPRGVQVIAAANPPERAADGWDLAPPLANRLLHIDYSPATDAWIEGMTSGFTLPAGTRVAEPDTARGAASRANVAAFIRSRRELLDALPADASASGRAWPSRRTWTMLADLLAVLPDDDQDAARVGACGLVGDGAGHEYLTWRRNADLPDPADVLADPASVAWAELDPSRTWAVLAGVVGYSTGRGTQEAWRQAWGPLAVAAEQGRADVAAACARTLLTARPPKAAVPKAAKAFAQVLTDAGLMAGAA
jgi:MoxR-like ATPase